MRFFLVLIIILSFLSITFQKVVLFSVYQVNKDFIIENYCVNKEKPELECDGKCHLAKMFKKSEKPESGFPFSEIIERTLDYIGESSITLEIKKEFFLKIKHHSHYTLMSSQPHILKLLKPPII